MHSRQKNSGIWALIPAYNEERTIREVIKRTKKFVDNLLIVNDGSTDKTGRLLRRLKNIKIINLENNSGKANALKVGIGYLRKMKASSVITIDADLQHLPEEIPCLLNSDADIVIGARKKLNTSMPVFRKLGNYLASVVVSAQLGMRITDPQSGFRIYNKRALNELDFEGDHFNIEKKTLKEASIKNFKIKEVPISCIYTNFRKSYFNFKDIISFLKS